MSDRPERLPPYVPPTGDEPLDAIERALVRLFAGLVLDDIAAEEQQATTPSEPATVTTPQVPSPAALASDGSQR